MLNQQKFSFQTHVVVGQIQFFLDYQTEGLAFLLAASQKEATLGFLLYGSLLHQSQKERKRKESTSKMETIILSHVSTEVTSHHSLPYSIG